MGEPIHDMKMGSGDVLVSNGYYAVNADGHVVLVPASAPLKPTMRLATAADIAAAKARNVGLTADGIAKIKAEQILAERASHASGLEQKVRDAENAERAKAKAGKIAAAGVSLTVPVPVDVAAPIVPLPGSPVPAEPAKPRARVAAPVETSAKD